LLALSVFAFGGIKESMLLFVTMFACAGYWVLRIKYSEDGKIPTEFHTKTRGKGGTHTVKHLFEEA